MEKRISDTSGGQTNMNLRYWGGWFLVVAALSIILTMGCEKGALGVKPALVMGRVVDQDNPSTFVEGATIRMVSIEEMGTGELKQGYNFATAISDAEGKFIFENVQPDNVMLEVAARGYAKTVFPSSPDSGGDSEEEAGDSADYDKVYVKSGSVMDLGAILLKKISNPLPDTVGVSVVLRDAKTLELLDSSSGDVTISFNTQTFTLPVSNWRNGVDRSGNVIKLTAENEFTVTAKANSDLYRIAETTVSGASDLNIEILLEPVTYNIMLRAVRVPDYIHGGVVNVFAESRAVTTNNPGGAPKVIATHTINNLGNLSEPNLPEIIAVSGLAMPVDLRIQVRGYRDEVVRITSDALKAGAQGNYRIDVDFLYDNGTEFFDYDPNYDPNTRDRSRAGLFDNIIGRDVVLTVAGPDLQSNDRVYAMINLPYKTVDYYSPRYPSLGDVSRDNGPVTAVFRKTAVGYLMNYNVIVYSIASGVFNISPEEGIMINPPSEDPARGLDIVVHAERPK